MPRGFLSRKERLEKFAKPKSANKPITSRVRSRDLRVSVAGVYTPPPPQVPVLGSALVGIRQDCLDVLYNFKGVNPFDAYTREEVYPVLDGFQYLGSGPTINRSISNFPVGYRPGAVDPRVAYPALLPTEISDFAWATMARTNPNRPHVEVPAFIGELKDFFDLIRGKGASLIKQAASGYLAWQWTLKPLWSDLQKMLRFQNAVNRRAEMLHNLQSGNEIRKRVELRKRSTVGSTKNVTIHSQGPFISGKVRVESSERVWGTATWKIAPTTKLPRLAKIKTREFLDSARQRGWEENERFLNALASGTAEIKEKGLLSHDTLATAWELCPWSWLIDWATGYGDIIAATRNAIPVTWSNIAVMRTTTSRRVFFDIGTDSSWHRLIRTGNYFELATRKERYRPLLLPFSLPCFLPLIEEGHWQILASLAITSGRLPRG